MSNIPNDSEDEARTELWAMKEEEFHHSSWLWRLILLLRDSTCVRLPVVLILAAVIGGIMLKLSTFMPGYLAILLFFLLGLVGWGFVIGFPIGQKKNLMKVWVWFALAWGGALCLIYAQGLHQRHDDSSLVWSVLGWVLGISAFVVLYVFFPNPRKAHRNSDEDDSERRDHHR